jgi:tRNA threonylcarbamoyladenosine biosynthesis protein TsaB
VIVLAIDTAGATASAAVLAPDASGVATSEAPRAHARVLPSLIDAAAESAGVPLPQVTHVAVSRGPGLFTGMRVGLVTAQMFALARDLPVAGVSSLDAAARRVVEQQRPAADFAILLDARRREVFAQVFGPDGTARDEPRSVDRDGVRSTAGVPSAVPDSAIWTEYAAAGLGFPGVAVAFAGLAAEVALVARDRWLAGDEQDPVTPLYLRRPDTSAANPQRSVLGHR